MAAETTFCNSSKNFALVAAYLVPVIISHYGKMIWTDTHLRMIRLQALMALCPLHLLLFDFPRWNFYCASVWYRKWKSETLPADVITYSNCFYKKIKNKKHPKHICSLHVKDLFIDGGNSFERNVSIYSDLNWMSKYIISMKFLLIDSAEYFLFSAGLVLYFL